MKTRIISGIIMGVVFGGLLALGYFVNSLFIIAALTVLAVIGIYELLHNALKVENKAANIAAMAATFLMTAFADINLYKSICDCEPFFKALGIIKNVTPLVFFFAAAFIILKNHEKFDLGQIFSFAFAPIILSFGFSKMGQVVMGVAPNGGEYSLKLKIYYLLLMFSFACMCDMGAYFVGVTMGKHKLCPEISPKKTVEGALGGILTTVILVVVLMFAFGYIKHIVPTVIFTIPLCVLGMIGDLFASIIKRKAGIKDYGNLIPGHGGVLDRFDSLLFVAPAVNILMLYGVI